MAGPSATWLVAACQASCLVNPTGKPPGSVCQLESARQNPARRICSVESAPENLPRRICQVGTSNPADRPLPACCHPATGNCPATASRFHCIQVPSGRRAYGTFGETCGENAATGPPGTTPCVSPHAWTRQPDFRPGTGCLARCGHARLCPSPLWHERHHCSTRTGCTAA